MRSLIVLIGLVCLVSLFVGSAFGQTRPCVTYSRDCNGCQQAAGCGWCANSTTGIGFCQDSTAQSNCTSDGNIWNDCSVGDGCYAGYTTCDDCKTNAKCGWCPASDGVFAAFLGACLPLSYESQCTSSWNDCDQATCAFAYAGDCKGCSGNPQCGWCGNSTGLGVCFSSTDGEQNCIDSGYGEWNATCVDLFSCVSDYSEDCDGCVADSRCGWCSVGGSGSCVTSASESLCLEQGDSEWNVCTAGVTCGSKYVADCNGCQDDANCAWCTLPGDVVGLCMDNSQSQASGLCAARSGTLDGACPEDSCTLKYPGQDDCTACQADVACGWCYTSQTQKGICVLAAAQVACIGAWNDLSVCSSGSGDSAASTLSNPFQLLF